MELVTMEVSSDTREMKMNVTREMIQDLNSAYGIDVESHLEKILRLEKLKDRKNKIEKIKENILCDR